MRTIIAGSRSLTDMRNVENAMWECGWRPIVVITGCARGIDSLGEKWARVRSIPVERYPADWKLHGRGAGVVRNRDMAKVAEALVAIWDGKSRGARNMIEVARKRGLRVYIHRIDMGNPITGKRPSIIGV